MNRRDALKALAGLAFGPRGPSAAFGAERAHWNYEGEEGPAHWGDIDAASAICSAGAQQSPIDIVSPVKATLPRLQMSWARTSDTIANNGHTIELAVGPGSWLAIGNSRYTFVQFHFHHPSEHRIGGRSFPMEAHFVHQNDTGNLAVVGVLMTSGRSNEVFGRIVAAMPVPEGPPMKAPPAIDPNALLPSPRRYYRYEGSLTTPPCTETVDWLLLREPLPVATPDIEAFARLFPMNARPAQKLNRRFVLTS